MEEQKPTPPTAAAVCDALGRREMAARLERTVAAVSNAASEGVFPSGWFLVISKMCEDRGVECPLSLFNFLAPADAISAAANLRARADDIRKRNGLVW